MLHFVEVNNEPALRELCPSQGLRDFHLTIFAFAIYSITETCPHNGLS